MVSVRRSLPWLGAIAVIIAVGNKAPLTRGPEFHHYADQRTWLGIPHAGDVLSNLAFIVAAAWVALRMRAPKVPAGFASAACAGVALIGIGSALYHVAPADTTLAFDWAPIAITLSLIVATLIADRIGARAGAIAAMFGSVCAASAVIYWWTTGGTAGGDMAPYVAAQLLGVALPLLVAVSRPGQIATVELLLAIAGFAAARMFAAHDAELLSMVGISGHSLKHMAAAVAAAVALRALYTRS